MKQRIMNMLSQLQEYKRDKTMLMEIYVSERLDKSFAVYDQQLTQSIDFLTKKHEKSLVKRIQKLDDKST